MQGYSTRIVIYHSEKWGQLADDGWITHTVVQDGQYRIAIMIREPRNHYIT